MTLRFAAIVCLALLSVACPACDGDSTPIVQRGPTPVIAPMKYRGLAVQVQSGYKPVEHFTPLFREIADMGANTVLLIAPGFMEHAESQTIFLEARKLPSPEDFKTIIRNAREADLNVILMPIILLSKPRGSEWRGVIKPPDWEDWWRQYREFIVYFCEIAREGGANVLMVGSELVSTEKQTAQWVRVIETARENFYGGELGYSANWDHFRPVQFWDKLDLVGMTSYYTLAEEKNPTVDEIVAHWQPIRDDLAKWQEEIGRPIVFTEVGWCSQEGAATSPWNYYHNQKATPAGHEEQRRLYEAFIRVWDNEPMVGGVIWWDWSDAAGGPGDFGYTPRNKPAERVLRDWFAKYRPTTAASAPAATAPSTRPAEPTP